MLNRTILVAALLSAPLALSPASISAQERGVDRAATASAGAAMTNSPAELPPGLADRSDQALPPGMLLTRGGPAEDGATSEGSTDDDTSDECKPWINPETGQLECG